MKPSSLNDWTYEFILHLLTQGISEADWFDFKERLPDSRNDADKAHLRKAAAAFANADGGFLVFGIQNTGTGVDRIIGIDTETEFAKRFGEQVQHLEPSIDWDFRNPGIAVPGTDKYIHVVWIKRSWRKPVSLKVNDHFEFVKRTNKGVEYMTYSEVRGAFQEAEYRRTKLALLISEVKNLLRIARNLEKGLPTSPNVDAAANGITWAFRYNTTLLDLTVGDAFSFLAEDEDLWDYLCAIREAAVESNSSCEAYLPVAHRPINQLDPFYYHHVGRLRACARAIDFNGSTAVRCLEDLMK